MDDALAVISASTDNVEILHQVLAERARDLCIPVDALRPEDWLHAFQSRRKGAGSAPQGPAPAASAIPRAALV
jgi:type IV secretion system protein VirB4